MISTNRRHHWALATVCVVLFLTFLDNTVVSVALANIRADIPSGVTDLEWVVNGYALTFAAFMLAGGTLGDLYGRKKVMMAGIAIFCAGSVLCAVADDSPILIIGRAVMGVGAAASEPGTLSMIRHVYPDRRRRARALGAWAAVSGLALALGPVIGGILVGLWDFRAIFWFNLIFGVLVFIAAGAVLPENSDPQGRHLDIPGLVLGAVALGAIVGAIITGETEGYDTWWILALFALGGLAAVGFVLAERHVRDPVIAPRFWRNGAFTGSNIVVFCAYFSIFSIFFFVALYLQEVIGKSAFQLAAAFLPMAAALIAASALTGRWVARRGARIPMTIGSAVAALGVGLTDVILDQNVNMVHLALVLVIAGAGFGIVLVPVTTAVLSTVPAERSGMAASVTNTSRELGAVFGVAVLGALTNAQLNSSLTSQLKALGIPADFQAIIFAAITQGASPSQGGAAAHANPGLAHLIDEVTNAAYTAFADGLHVALLTSTLLLVAATIVAATLVRRPRQVLNTDLQSEDETTATELAQDLG